MKMNRLFAFARRWMRLALGLAAFLLLSNSIGRGDDQVQLWCRNDFIPPLVNNNFPSYPDIAKYYITILTDPDTTPGMHWITVVDDTDPDNPLNKKVFDFRVNSDGTVTGSDPTAETSQAEPCPTSPFGKFYATVIGVYSFAGDNLPFESPTPADQYLHYQFPFVFNQLQLLLDNGNGFVSTPSNTDNEQIVSSYYYDSWALTHGGAFNFLPNEGPYLSTGANLYAEKWVKVFYGLPGKLAQAKNQPFPCAPEGCHGCGGMPVASLDRFQAGVAITDTPISYTPGVGMSMPFTVHYHQRLGNQPATFNYSNLGPLWQAGWISYIADGPTNNGDPNATYHAADGSQYTYQGYFQNIPVGPGTRFIQNGDFQTNEAWTHATLHYRQNPERYERWLPDGTVETYALGAGTVPNRYFFLTSITDPQGNVTKLSYDPTAAANGQAVLTSITDPTGSQLIFSYNPSAPTEIAKVTRSNDGLAAKFTYANGQLTSITDTLGMTSSFKYAAGSNFISAMTTPYGTTTFSSSDGSGYLEADMTNPLNETERVEYQENLATSLFPASESGTPAGLDIDNTKLNTANSFYWTRRAMADAAAQGVSVDSAAFYAKAQVTHWAESALGSIPVPLSTKMPLEGRVWYNYPGQPDADTVEVTAAGASTSPGATGRVLDDGTTQASAASYNANGLITQSVDPLGRTTNYVYASNGIDLTQVSQVNGSGQDVLSTMTYDSRHDPLTVTDASGQTTRMSYNGQGQLLTRTDAKNETTTLAYFGNGYLQSVTGPVSGATTSYTYYSAGRVQTATDSEGYVVTYAYDNLDRPTVTTYPNGTTDKTVYNKLDVAQITDRQGRSTYNFYDPIRELLQTTDPLGRGTWYSWCTCGGLSTLTDANGNVTTWGLDLQGRVTSKTYADSSAINYVYEASTSRLHSMTDARGNVAVYSYNIDNTLSGTTYTPGSGVAATPNVSFAYDPVYNRVTSMTDGTGTTNYSYNPITGSVTTGAGRLGSVSIPIAGSTAAVAYTYDELGRVTGRTIDGSANSTSTTFDSLGRVTGVTNPLGAFTYAYVDQTSRLASVTYPNWQMTKYCYFNNVGDQRLKEIKNYVWGVFANTPLSDFQYTFNPVGTIATWTQQTDASTPIVNTLSYDGADQLTGDVQSGGGSAYNNYAYDPAGNRLSETTASGTTGGQFNNLNQLVGLGATATTTVSGHTSAAVTSATVNTLPASITDSTNFTANVPLPPGTNIVSVVAQPPTGAPVTQRVTIVTAGTIPSALTYDANGNTLTDEKGYAYTWDALNRLTKITYPSGASSLFCYDGLSRRVGIIEKNSSGTVTSTKNYLWVGSEMAEERDGSNNVTKRFFPQGELQSGTSYYYTSDHNGNVRELCNASGTILTRYTYDPYGRTTTNHLSGSVDATFQYAGMFMHPTSGLYLTKYRAYDSSTGRWINRDPMGEDGGFNLYGYCDNDPVDETDPLGLSCYCDQLKAQILSKLAKLGKELAKYDPGSDAKGGHRYGPKINIGGIDVGSKVTKPGGHYQEIRNLQQGLVNDITNYFKYCSSNDNNFPPGFRSAVSGNVPVPPGIAPIPLNIPTYTTVTVGGIDTGIPGEYENGIRTTLGVTAAASAAGAAGLVSGPSGAAAVGRTVMTLAPAGG